MVLALAVGFGIVTVLIPGWGARPDEIAHSLPGDDFVAEPQITWNHAISIHASPEQIYPWLIQIGDTRGGYYSYTFIENLFMIAARDPGRYVNASRIHPEWQDPQPGQGMIINFLTLASSQPDQYVLATTTQAMPLLHWSWLWYLEPQPGGITRLIVRHRMSFPPGSPGFLMTAISNAGYPMERGMLLGIRDRAEGRIPGGFEEPLGIFLWLLAFACGIASAVRYVRHPGYYHPLGIGLEAIAGLFVFTYVQPAIWVRVIIDLALVASVVIGFYPGKVSRWVRARADS